MKEFNFPEDIVRDADGNPLRFATLEEALAAIELLKQLLPGEKFPAQTRKDQ